MVSIRLTLELHCLNSLTPVSVSLTLVSIRLTLELHCLNSLTPVSVSLTLVSIDPTLVNCFKHIALLCMCLSYGLFLIRVVQRGGKPPDVYSICIIELTRTLLILGQHTFSGCTHWQTCFEIGRARNVAMLFILILTTLF